MSPLHHFSVRLYLAAFPPRRVQTFQDVPGRWYYYTPIGYEFNRVFYISFN